MKHLKPFKIFEEYGAYEDVISQKNKEWKESINSYATWVPKMYSYWKGFESTIGQKMSELPGGIFQIETSAYPQLGYGPSLKNLLKFMEDYKNPLDLVKYLDENKKKEEEIRTKLKGRWDDIFNKKGTNEEYKAMKQLQDLDKDLSDLHWIWKTCFEDHYFEDYHDIDEVITDFADDHNLVVYLCYVELFRGLQLGFLVCDEKDEIVLSTRWNRATDEYSYVGIERKGGYTYGRGRFGDEIWDGAKKVTKRLEHYFSTTSYRPLHEMIYISLANQKD